MTVSELLKLLERVPTGYRNLPVCMQPHPTEADVTGLAYAHAPGKRPKEDGYPSPAIIAVVLLGVERK